MFPSQRLGRLLSLWSLSWWQMKRQKKNKYFKFCNLLCQKTFTWKKISKFQIETCVFAEVTLLHCSKVMVLLWWRIGHTKQKQIFAPYYNPILPLLYYVLFYVWLGQAAMSMLQGKIILSIKGSHDVYQEFILLLQTDSKLFLWLILIFEDALMLQIATSHFTVTLQ